MEDEQKNKNEELKIERIKREAQKEKNRIEAEQKHKDKKLEGA